MCAWQNRRMTPLTLLTQFICVKKPQKVIVLFCFGFFFFFPPKISSKEIFSDPLLPPLFLLCLLLLGAVQLPKPTRGGRASIFWDGQPMTGSDTLSTASSGSRPVNRNGWEEAWATFAEKVYGSIFRPPATNMPTLLSPHPLSLSLLSFFSFPRWICWTMFFLRTVCKNAKMVHFNLVTHSMFSNHEQNPNLNLQLQRGSHLLSLI